MARSDSMVWVLTEKTLSFMQRWVYLTLDILGEILQSRINQSSFYDEFLAGLKVQKPKIAHEVTFNRAYYPVVFENNELMISVKNSLENSNIYPRRYFYPSLSQLNYVRRTDTPISEDVAKRILCLPLYYDLNKSAIKNICDLINKTFIKEKI
jgi:dTDP-4-amino-4,6-dideoxygalactose transaminase